MAKKKKKFSLRTSDRFEIMLKKSAIFGLILLAGIAVLKWAVSEKRKEQQELTFYKQKYGSETDKYLTEYNEWLKLPPQEQALLPWGLSKSDKTKTEAQIRQQQYERLRADLDKLAAGEIQAHPFGDILYGKNWQDELRKYKKQKETREFIFTSSIVCTSTAGAIFSWCILLWIARLIIRILSCLRHLQRFIAYLNRPPAEFFKDVFRIREKNKDKKTNRVITRKNGKNLYQPYRFRETEDKTQGYPPVLINSGWQNPIFTKGEPNLILDETNLDSATADKCRQTSFSAKNRIYSSSQDRKSNLDYRQTSKKRLATQSTLDSNENNIQLEDKLKAQAENLEKQIAEFRQMAQSVQQVAFEHSKPLNNAIEELTQQVSAVREYATYQQDRVKKLQDGYDWNIIRTFCLRLIRCIDNLESRIEQLSKEGIDSADLEEVKDELLFALQSSGVEQFQPELNSDYRGQEKFAEVIKDKQHCNDHKKAGKIAKVIRPGYQYIISEDNIKIVRTAQVQLYG